MLTLLHVFRVTKHKASLISTLEDETQRFYKRAHRPLEFPIPTETFNEARHRGIHIPFQLVKYKRAKNILTTLSYILNSSFLEERESK